jgi:tripartite-type tricarboxylate transporter receptor subunit TctC
MPKSRTGSRSGLCNLFKIGVLAVALPCASFSQAQGWPAKPIRLVTAVSGGGETSARIFAQELAQALGQPVVVDVQSGAGGGVGAQIAARSAPDGYTLLYATLNSQVYRLFLVKDVGYDPVKDFTGIARVVDTTLCIAAGPSAPYKTLAEMIDFAKRNPGQISYSTTGVGTGHHLNSEQLRAQAGIDFVHVPYKSGPQQTQDLIGGRVPVAGTILSNLVPLAKAGKVRILAIIGQERSALFPDVPTVREVVPGFTSLEGWTAFFGPAGLPRTMVTRVNAEVVKATQNPQIRAQLEQTGYAMNPSTPEELDALVKRDIGIASKLAARAGIKPE